MTRDGEKKTTKRTIAGGVRKLRARGRGGGLA